MKCRIVSLYMPTSSYPEEEYEAVLTELEKKVLDGCKQDGRIPIIGADINGSVGTSKDEETEEEDESHRSTWNRQASEQKRSKLYVIYGKAQAVLGTDVGPRQLLYVETSERQRTFHRPYRCPPEISQ